MSTEAHDELIALTQHLLEVIGAGDWKKYAELCDPSISCFEPEARGELVEGMPFHQFYFELGGAPTKKNTTMVRPHVRMLGNNAAIVSYVRLVQRLNATGAPETVRAEETRVWEKQGGDWKHVHFHRSLNS